MRFVVIMLHYSHRMIVFAALACVGLGGCTTTGFSKLLPWSSSSVTAANSEAVPTTTVSIFAKKPEASPELHVATARIYERNGNYTAAEEEYIKALKKAPKDEAALLSYAHLLDHQSKLTDATQLYERAIKTNPKEPAAYNDLGLCLARRGMMKDAAGALAKAVALQPDRPLYRNNLATVLVEESRPDDALAQLKAVYPEAIAQYNLGVMLGEHQQDALAEMHFGRALQADPTLAQAQAWRERLAARNSSGSKLAAAALPGWQAAGTPYANYQGAAPPSPARVAAVPAPNPATNSYGMAPEPEAVANYLHPELSPTLDAARLASRYGVPGSSNSAMPSSSTGLGNASAIGQPSIPPMPESVSTYAPNPGPGLQYLPPVQ